LSRLLARRALLAPVALLLATGCGLLRAELEVKTVCATLPDYAMPATPVSGTFTTDLTYDLGADLDVLSDPDFSSSLRLQRLELVVAPGSGAIDLTGVETLSATVLPPAGASLPEVVAAQYTRGAAPSPTSLSATTLSDTNLVPYLDAGKALLHLEASGTMPTEPWTATVTACFLMEVAVDYGNKL
jgi:hypothetical protein